MRKYLKTERILFLSFYKFERSYLFVTIVNSAVQIALISPIGKNVSYITSVLLLRRYRVVFKEQVKVSPAFPTILDNNWENSAEFA